MAINKVVYGQSTIMDLTDTTAVASDVASGKYFYLANGQKVSGTYTGGAAQAGYVWQDQSGYVHLSDESGDHIYIEPLSITSNGTYSASSGHAYTPITVSVPTGITPSGTYNITSNGTYDVTSYASAEVSVSGGGGIYQSKTVIPTESQQIVLPDNGEDLVASVYGVKSVRDTYADVTVDLSALAAGTTYHIIGYGSTSNIGVPGDTENWSINVTASYSSGMALAYTTDNPGGNLSSINVYSDHIRVTFDSGTEQSVTISNLSFYTIGGQSYDALSQVIVEAIPSAYVIPSGTLNITVDGVYDVKNYLSTIVSVGSGSGLTVDNIATKNIGAVIGGSASLIRESAFTGYDAITEVSFPNCSIIGSGAFWLCSNLTSVYFSSCTSIYNNAFRSCYSLVTVSFPECISISNYAFERCSNLQSISFPKCTTIGGYAFQTCSSLSYYSLPKCTTIGSGAFANCALREASFSEVTSLYSQAFQNNSFLSIVNFPKCSFTYSGVFSSCSNLTDVSLPICSTINAYVFAQCSNLTSINLPSAKSIYNSAFASCRYLSTVILNHNSTIGYISNSAFASCASLTSLYLLASNRYTLAAANAFAYTPLSLSAYLGKFGSIFVPSACYDSYISQANWSFFSSRFVSLTDTEVNNVLMYGRHDP